MPRELYCSDDRRSIASVPLAASTSAPLIGSDNVLGTFATDGGAVRHRRGTPLIVSPVTDDASGAGRSMSSAAVALRGGTNCDEHASAIGPVASMFIDPDAERHRARLNTRDTAAPRICDACLGSGRNCHFPQRACGICGGSGVL